MDDTDTMVEVEACLPLAPGRAQPRQLPPSVEVLPAATLQFASNVLRGRDAFYPLALDGFDAAATRIARHGFDFAGPATEIYKHWNGEAQHADNVMEVGSPVTSQQVRGLVPE